MKTRIKTNHTVTNATIESIMIDGHRVSHRDLMLACHHEDTDVAREYRRIVEGVVLPAIRAAEHAAYERYLSAPPSVSGGTVAGGHGSVSIGPDPASQQQWMKWGSLLAAYIRAIDGRGVNTVHAHRISPVMAQPWEIEADA